jgi:D-lactate dehydrogenase
MKICLVATEKQESLYFKEQLAGHDTVFADSLGEAPKDVEILSIFVQSHVDAAFLDAHPALRMIANRSTGCDHIDMEACRQRGIEVALVPSYGDRTVAEHTFMLILCLAKRICEAQGVKKQRSFSYEKLRGFDLAGKVLGVIGCGRIGSEVARLAHAFRMKVLAWDVRRDAKKARRIGFKYTHLDTLLAESDIITLHVPLNAGTRHLLNAASLARCKPGVFIVNTGRGGLIDTNALIENLDSGHVASVGLDVVEDERVLHTEMQNILSGQIIARLQNGSRATRGERESEIRKLMSSHDLVSRHNVISTPHTAFNTVEAVERINQATVKNILSFIGKKAAAARRTRPLTKPAKAPAFDRSRLHH